MQRSEIPPAREKHCVPLVKSSVDFAYLSKKRHLVYQHTRSLKQALLKARCAARLRVALRATRAVKLFQS